MAPAAAAAPTGGVGADKSGPLAADETWSGAINMTGDVTVNAGVTLTIADGALVQVAAGKALIIQGTLKINGTAATGVTFTPNPTPGTWDGIQVQTGGAATISLRAAQVSDDRPQLRDGRDQLHRWTTRRSRTSAPSACRSR